MLACLLIHPDILKRQGKAESMLAGNNLSKDHPDLLWFGAEEKLGIAQARQIKEFLSLKPYRGSTQAVVLIAAENLTDDAQNALLKTLEEPPVNTVLILGVASEDQLLPTVLSRCQVINLENPRLKTDGKFNSDIEKLLESSMEKRFQFVEKLDMKEEFLYALTSYFRHKLLENSAGVKLIHPGGGKSGGGKCGKYTEFLQDLIEAERWAKQNVNIRAILEYLMLRMPSTKN